MICTLTDLLNSIKKQGIERIEEFLYIKHGPTIGAMYEGLTKELMSKAIFEEFDLKVCSGFIENSDKEVSKQIDCMIVTGEGKKIPYTNDYIFDIHQVIAVIEVKKDLFSRTLESAYMNLLSVKKVVKADKDMQIDRLEEAYKVIVGKQLPFQNEFKVLSEAEQYLYHALVVEAYMPIRITFGYGGFTTEEGLRDAFISFLEKNLKEKGYGITSIPSIIIAGENSLLKTNGIPFGIVEKDNNLGEWIAMASTNNSPVLLLLNLIWARLYYLFDNIQENVFDNYNIQFNPLLRVKGSRNGWEYTYIRTQLQENSIRKWEPIEISLMSNALLKMIEKGYSLYVSDNELQKICEENGESFNNILSDMRFKRIISIKDSKINMLSDNWMTVAYNGKFFYGDNFNNRMLEWYENLLKEKLESNKE